MPGDDSHTITESSQEEERNLEYENLDHTESDAVDGIKEHEKIEDESESTDFQPIGQLTRLEIEEPEANVSEDLTPLPEEKDKERTLPDQLESEEAPRVSTPEAGTAMLRSLAGGGVSKRC